MREPRARPIANRATLKQAYSQYRLGRTLVDQLQAEEALPLLITAAATFKATGDLSDAAHAEVYSGHALARLGRTDEAFAIYRRIRSVIAQAEARGDEPSERGSRTCLARMLVEEARYDEAADVLEPTSPEGWATDRVGYARHLIVLGVSKFHVGLLTESAAHFAEVLTRGPIEGWLELHATAYEHLALMAEQAGQGATAAPSFAKAVALYLAAGEPIDARRLSTKLLADDSTLSSPRRYRDAVARES